MHSLIWTHGVGGLKDKIARLIEEQGPIGIARYMEIALADPEQGYYMSRDPFGTAGDFVTAPEISQIFGELIALFLIQAWEDQGRPGRVHLVELGPGRGTMMADMLRACRHRPAFRDAARVTLVETSPALRRVQEKTLASAPVTWTRDLGDVPEDAPLFLVANEFFDALPIRQFVRSPRGWHERMVRVEKGALRFETAGEPVSPAPLGARENGTPGQIFETSPAGIVIAQDIARRVRSHGVALIIDYGHAESGLGDTLQAVRHHRFADVLDEPGQADLTAHVDFAALARAAEEAGARAFGPVTQGAFLETLGIGLRADTLKSAAPAQAKDIDAAIARLTSPAGMGTLFKVLALAAPKAPPLAGFSC